MASRHSTVDFILVQPDLPTFFSSLELCLDIPHVYT